MYATKMYCIFLKDQTGNDLVISVYMVPAVASARVAKQNMSCTAHASWMGNILSTLVRAQTMSGWLLRVEAVLARWQRIWHLLVVVDLGKWA